MSCFAGLQSCLQGLCGQTPSSPELLQVQKEMLQQLQLLKERFTQTTAGVQDQTIQECDQIIKKNKDEAVEEGQGGEGGPSGSQDEWWNQSKASPKNFQRNVLSQLDWMGHLFDQLATKTACMEMRQCRQHPTGTDAVRMVDQWSKGEMWTLPQSAIHEVAEMDALRQGLCFGFSLAASLAVPCSRVPK